MAFRDFITSSENQSWILIMIATIFVLSITAELRTPKTNGVNLKWSHIRQGPNNTKISLDTTNLPDIFSKRSLQQSISSKRKSLQGTKLLGTKLNKSIEDNIHLLTDSVPLKQETVDKKARLTAETELNDIEKLLRLLKKKQIKSKYRVTQLVSKEHKIIQDNKQKEHKRKTIIKEIKNKLTETKQPELIIKQSDIGDKQIPAHRHTHTPPSNTTKFAAAMFMLGIGSYIILSRSENIIIPNKENVLNSIIGITVLLAIIIMYSHKQPPSVSVSTAVTEPPSAVPGAPAITNQPVQETGVSIPPSVGVIDATISPAVTSKPEEEGLLATFFGWFKKKINKLDNRQSMEIASNLGPPAKQAAINAVRRGAILVTDLNASELKGLQDLYNAFNVDGQTGLVGPSELRWIMTAIGKANITTTAEEIEQILQSLDTSKDDLISFDEYAVYMLSEANNILVQEEIQAKELERKEAIIHAENQFTKYDINKDGGLSAEELQLWVNKDPDAFGIGQEDLYITSEECTGEETGAEGEAEAEEVCVEEVMRKTNLDIPETLWNTYDVNNNKFIDTDELLNYYQL